MFIIHVHSSFIISFIHLSIPQFFHSFYSSRLRSGCSSSNSLITCSSSEAETRNLLYLNITPRLRSGCISPLRSGCSSSTPLGVHFSTSFGGYSSKSFPSTRRELHSYILHFILQFFGSSIFRFFHFIYHSSFLLLCISHPALRAPLWLLSGCIKKLLSEIGCKQNKMGCEYYTLKNN